MGIKKIHCFDFDKTFFHTQEPEEGRKIWLRETGEMFPHPTGWWSKPESLDLKMFYPAINGWTYKYYKEAMAEEDSYVMLATGRLDKLKTQVQAVLDFHNVKFDDVFCCTGGDTYRFKTRLFESILRKNLKAEEFIIYDDRHEHLLKFVEWAKLMGEKFKTVITIIDVVNKKQLS
jgi:hypothetical protein